MFRRLLAPAVTAAVLLSASAASAAEPAVVKEGGSVAGLLGLGMNYYGFAIGARGGYTLPNHVYLGGTLLANVGFGGWGAGFSTGFEGGYDIEAGPVIVRPYGGLGLVDVNYGYGGGTVCNFGVCTTVPGGGYSSSSVFFLFWVGGTVMYPIKNGPWFVGGDLRFIDSPGIYINNFAVALLGTGGYHF